MARIALAAVLFKNQIIVSGGCSNNSFDGTTDSIEVLDLNHNPTEWKEFSVKLPIKVSGHKCVLYGNRLLIIGGRSNRRELLDTIYELLLVHPYSSKLLCHMKKKRADHGVELFDNKVLIAGGKGAETDVEVFDITTNECVEMPPLPSPVRCMATVRRDDTMLLIGGFNDKRGISKSIIEYDFKTGQCGNIKLEQWQWRIGCAAIYHENTLILIGGAVDCNAVDCFNFSSHSWNKLSSLSRDRYFSSAVIVKKEKLEF